MIHSAPATPSTAAWRLRLFARMRRYFVVKALGVTAFTWVFFIAYFHLLRHPANPVTQMPLLAPDTWVPYQPAWLPAYLSLWVYVGIAPGMSFTLRALVRYGIWALLLCLAGLAVFYLWPTAVPPRGEVPALLRGVDAAGNACPSMHVAAAIFTAWRIEAVLCADGAPRGLRALNAAWFVAIAYSTMAVRQHVALDVLAGAVLGSAVAAASLWWPRPTGPDPLSLDRKFRRLR